MTVGAFAAKFATWMNFSITLEPFLGTFDAYGNPQYGAGIPLNCYMEEKVRIVKDATGQERASSTKLYVAGGPLDPHDRVTMPIGFKGPSNPPIIWVSNVNDIQGFDHSEVYL